MRASLESLVTQKPAGVQWLSAVQAAAREIDAHYAGTSKEPEYVLEEAALVVITYFDGLTRKNKTSLPPGVVPWWNDLLMLAHTC